MPNSYDFIGRGVYSLTEASRLTGIPRQRLRNWVAGYTRSFDSGRRSYEPLVMTYDPIDNIAVLDFAALIEVRFLEAFRKHGVSTKAIRIASRRAREILNRDHPFSTKMFKTDGHHILVEILDSTGDEHLLDLVVNQFEFQDLVAPYLFMGVEFNDLDEPMRWWPLGRNKDVVIDPQRAFGSPLVDSAGVPTLTLRHAFASGESIVSVSDWFGIPEKSIQDALEFERTFAS